MTMVTPTVLVLRVDKKDPELIVPAKPTPNEFKSLSDIDDQKGLRLQVPSLHFYRNVLGMQGRDPVKVIREAISKALVYYYPFAGRLREGPNEKLIVECTGEGIMFIEADANVRLDQFGDLLQPPFPGAKELIYNVPGSDGILHCPILLMQVTRLVCGGFIVGCRLNHTMSDGTGFVQFLTAVAEIARGASDPSVKPVWNRELLMARNPPRITCVHHVYDESQCNNGLPFEDMVYQEELIDISFFFSLPEIASLKNLLPYHLRTCSKYEILSTCIWRCRTIALNFNSSDYVQFVCVVDARSKMNPPLPVGYYGNALGLSVAVTTVGELCKNPLGYALELVKKAKADVTDEFMKSTADFLVINGRPNYANIRSYEVADITHMGLKNIDFGWGKPLYSGPIDYHIEECYFQLSTNNKGEHGIFAMVSLPRPSMERFTVEIKKMIREANGVDFSSLFCRVSSNEEAGLAITLENKSL